MPGNTTVIIVSYNTPDLLKSAYESLRKRYPSIPVIIVDGSPVDSKCWNYSMSLVNENTTVKNLEYNIGHGKGMHIGIESTTTEYVLLMDSDVEINKGGVIEAMVSGIGKSYGIGQVITVNYFGGNSQVGIPYLHPHFALINRTKYFEYSPFSHHGAPCINPMKQLPELVNMDLTGYITHHERGTRKLNPKEFNVENWD